MTTIFPAFHPSLAGRITPAIEAEFSKLYLQFEGALDQADEGTGKRFRGDAESVYNRRLQVLKMREQGKSYEEIAEALSVNGATVRKDYMIATSSRRESEPHIVARRKRVLELINAGLSVRNVAKKLGISQSTASHDLAIARHTERVA